MKKLLLCALLLLPGAAFCQDKPKPKPKPEKQETLEEKIQTLIEDLGNDSYKIREEATKALEKIGKPALKALQKALKSADLEVSSRAQELLEKITGRKRVTPKHNPDVAPPRRGISPGPDMPDMKELLKKLESFEGLSPGLKDTMDTMRKLLEGGNGGTPDMGEMQKLFEKFLNKGAPQPNPRSRPTAPIQRTTKVERDLGCELGPVSDVLRSHLNIPPNSGLVIRELVPHGHAVNQGLRKHDIILRVSTAKPPTTKNDVDWFKWRAKTTVLSPNNVNTLSSLRDRTTYFEVMRKGKDRHVVEMNQTVIVLPKKNKSKKDRDF